MLQSESRDSKLNAQSVEVIGVRGGADDYSTLTRVVGNSTQSIEASESLFFGLYRSNLCSHF